jgi:hypothetical protein
MGLLDEAIREHLELKRRSGADPTAVARAESEALAAVGTEDETSDADLEDWTRELAGDEAAGGVAAPPDGEPVADAGLAEFSSVGQETAELDMRAVLEEDTADAASPAGPFAAASSPPVFSADASADPLGRQVQSPPDAEAAPENIPGQERLSFE